MRKFKVGDIVKRTVSSFRDVELGGVFEVTGVLGRGSIELEGKTGAYDEAKFELFLEATSGPRQFKVGDRVRMIAEDPAYGRGEVNVGDTGVIVRTSGDDFVVDFPNQEDWNAHVDDIEHVDLEETPAKTEEVSLDEAVANWQNVSQQIKELQAQVTQYEGVMRSHGLRPL